MKTYSITQKILWNLWMGIFGSTLIVWLWPDYTHWSWQGFGIQCFLICAGNSLYGWDIINITTTWPRWIRFIKDYIIGVIAGAISIFLFWVYVIPRLLQLKFS